MTHNMSLVAVTVPSPHSLSLAEMLNKRKIESNPSRPTR
jgi:hypothetical protein